MSGKALLAIVEFMSGILDEHELLITIPKHGSYFSVGSTHKIIWEYSGSSNVSIVATTNDKTPVFEPITETVFNKTTTIYPTYINFYVNDTWPVSATYKVVITSVENPILTAISQDFYIWTVEEKDKKFVLQCFANILISIMYLNI
ncbi:1622_t:CDS:2 [Acaulospora morrowiae]|uniref:1622_t:CDS:1 n=1 Tax=Acaulospora morrowiae TaxID=94023 RepID=A0A9N9FWN1_9GLOM|nr:1622_t:CDS:2 [Acaulospora morrowiae]